MTSPRILLSVLPDNERRIEVFIVVDHTSLSGSVHPRRRTQ
jgi:hypothetical protein